MEALLDGKSPRIRFRSTLLVGIVKTDPILSVLETVLSTDEDAYVRECAALKIGSFRKERSIPTLVKALSDQSLGVRVRAIAALGEIGRSATPILIEMMEEELAREKIREITATSLIYAMMGTKDRRAMNVLMRAASHKKPSIRADSVTALRLFAVEGRKYGRDGTISAAGTPVDLAYKIQETDRQKAAEAITRALKDPHEVVRKSAEQAVDFIKQIEHHRK